MTGDQLKSLRLALGLDVVDFAELFGVTKANAYRWERLEGERVFQQNTLAARLAEALWVCTVKHRSVSARLTLGLRLRAAVSQGGLHPLHHLLDELDRAGALSQ